jgi:hypothetical protein
MEIIFWLGEGAKVISQKRNMSLAVEKAKVNTFAEKIARLNAKSTIGKFVFLGQWTVDDHNLAHESDLRWLNDQVGKVEREELERKIVIFTHHSPCDDPRANNPKHQGSEVSSGFVTDLRDEECWKSRAVRMWAFGHTHYNCDFEEVTGQEGLGQPKRVSHTAAEDFQHESHLSTGR